MITDVENSRVHRKQTTDRPVVRARNSEDKKEQQIGRLATWFLAAVLGLSFGWTIGGVAIWSFRPAISVEDSSDHKGNREANPDSYKRSDTTSDSRAQASPEAPTAIDSEDKGDTNQVLPAIISDREGRNGRHRVVREKRFKKFLNRVMKKYGFKD